MSKYICVRCGHESSQIGHLRKHLNKSRECIGYFDKTDRKMLLEMLQNGKQYLTYLEKVVKPKYNIGFGIQTKHDMSTGVNQQGSECKPPSTKSMDLEEKHVPCESTNSKPIVDSLYKCLYCNKIFNIRQSRWKHEKTCDKKISNIQTNIVDNTHSTSINNSNINSNNTTINNTNNNTLNVAANSPKMCVFGEEDISHIVKLDRINDYERIARRDPNKVIPTIVQDIYFNREHPENQTVKIEHIHGNIAMIRVGLPDEWEYVDRKDTINKMVKKGINAAETGKIDYDNLPKYDALVDNYYSEVNPYYNSTVKAIDTILVIDLKKTNSNRLLK